MIEIPSQQSCLGRSGTGFETTQSLLYQTREIPDDHIYWSSEEAHELIAETPEPVVYSLPLSRKITGAAFSHAPAVLFTPGEIISFRFPPVRHKSIWLATLYSASNRILDSNEN